jgi:hypothetical protein
MVHKTLIITLGNSMCCNLKKNNLRALIDPAIVLSMLFCHTCVIIFESFFCGSEYMQAFKSILYIYIYIYCRWKSSYQGERVRSHQRVCLFQGMTWNSNYTCHGILCVQWTKLGVNFSLCWYWWNFQSKSYKS